MKINTKHALELWQNLFGDKEYAKDFSGALICRCKYNERNATVPFQFNDGQEIHKIDVCVGWNIHHILPISKGGTNDDENLAIINITTHDIIKDDTSFVINGTAYEIRRKKGNSNAYYIAKQIVKVISSRAGWVGKNNSQA